MTKEESSILIVDADEPTRRLLADYLGFYYPCLTAGSADDAVALLSTTSFKVVMADGQTTASGVEVFRLVREMCPEAVLIIISRKTDIQYVTEAMRQGAYDYVVKPFNRLLVLQSVQRALRRQALVAAEHHYDRLIEGAVPSSANEVRRLNESLTGTVEALYTNYRATLKALAAALKARDVETSSHSDRVVAYCLRLGKAMGLVTNDLIALEQGALLHDIGKIGVPDAVLLKPGSLTPYEWTKMIAHVHQGLRIIDGIQFLSGARFVVGQHHEKFDGSGYPCGLRGGQIHINARIFATADAFDAITSDRPYRAAQSYAEARAEIVAGSSTHFDPDVVDTFLSVPEVEWADIRSAADSNDYFDGIMDKREICSFILSSKRAGGTTSQIEVLPPDLRRPAEWSKQAS
ncbi:MAG TPA: HD domain-containing phosphohydrolase [Blastocatellia bacterium]|nr:HD domain-containing phosphohydrolase [Blastocatellia bacterium]